MKVGIAGAGSIVPFFLAAAEKLEELTPFAICASERSREKMKKFSEEYGISHIYYSYEEMLQNPEIDVFYIAVPNHLHYEFTKKALETGRSVICEKPFCSNGRQLAELETLSKEKNVFLFEAISNQYFPNFLKTRELLENIGPVRIVEFNYSQYSSRYDAFLQGEILPVFDPTKDGGALMDLNVYNIHLAVGLWGKPEQAVYYPNIQKGVDTSGTLILTYPGFVCSLIAAKDCKAPCRISIQGERGCIYSESPSNAFTEVRFLPNRGEPVEFRCNKEPERLYYELETFCRWVREHDRASFEGALKHSRIVQEILDQARGIR